MEYSSSEGDELVESYMDVEDDTGTSNIDQGTGMMPSEIHGIGPSEGSMLSVDNGQLMAADGLGNNDEPCLGMEFESDGAAREFYNAYALCLGFGIRVARSRSERRKGIEVLIMKRFVCLKEGHHKKKDAESNDKKKRKRLSIRDGCPAMMEVVRRGPDKWVITKLVLEHTHVILSPDRVREVQLRRASGKCAEHENQLQELRRNVFGDTDAQGLFNYLKRMQSENSGFFYSIQVDSKNCVTNAVWADARARMSYTYFGDAVYFDTTYSQNEDMLPFAAFTGVNHHGDMILFGCALVLDRTESSYAWLFETWLTAMDKRLPFSFTTDEGKAISAAVAKVFPQCFHRLCRWRILSRCKKKLSDVYMRFPSLHDELRRCINECDTEAAFDMFWGTIIDKYDLRENSWLQSIFDTRHKWVPAYLTSSFFAELTLTHRGETVSRFFRNNFSTRVPLDTFITRFDQHIDSLYVNETQKDLDSFHHERLLKTTIVLEKQARGIFTNAAFEIFQMELIEALLHYAVKVQQDGPYAKYYVDRDNPPTRHTVFYNVADKKAWCDCCRYAFSAILCRHVLGVFISAGIVMLPEPCIMKRWTKRAKTGPELIGHNLENGNCHTDSATSRYNDLISYAMKCAEKGAVSAGSFRVAKEVLRKALMEIKCLGEKLTTDDLQQVDNR
ncbi:protein FAR1-RELATED SEQUENCE 5-like [Oryza brachyantha]|uniref:Protein FAR1-RELATED SEQUENCE n=1 Tax=Oryza brachyantha TaxID=4533 RepID=J3MFI4_ORYBR|nr:protein FAR1-RELATED SEQUENCE 5-like [Oryza brachyantha]